MSPKLLAGSSRSTLTALGARDPRAWAVILRLLLEPWVVPKMRKRIYPWDKGTGTRKTLDKEPEEAEMPRMILNV